MLWKRCSKTRESVRPMGTKPPKESKPPKQNTPTFLLELPLVVEQGQACRLRAHLEAGRQIYNAILSEGNKRLPGRICSHLAQAFVAFRENGIVDLAASFQVGTQSAGLSLLHHQGQFEQKGGGVLFWAFALLGWLGAHRPHAFSCLRTSLPEHTRLSHLCQASQVPLRCSLPSPSQTRNGTSSPG